MWDQGNLMVAGSGGSLWQMGHGGWTAMLGLHGVFWLLIFALLVVLLVIALRAVARDRRPAGEDGDFDSRRPHGEALDILNARFARGEIDRDEYLSRRKQLV